jgi:hypothetical protein
VTHIERCRSCDGLAPVPGSTRASKVSTRWKRGWVCLPCTEEIREANKRTKKREETQRWEKAGQMTLPGMTAKT